MSESSKENIESFESERIVGQEQSKIPLNHFTPQNGLSEGELDQKSRLRELDGIMRIELQQSRDAVPDQEQSGNIELTVNQPKR